MPLLPYIALWFLLLAAAVLSRVVGRRHRLAGVLGPLATGLAGVVWLLAAPGEPVSVDVAGWQWLIDDPAWQLTGMVLLLAMASALSGMAEDWFAGGDETDTGSPTAAVVLFLAAAGLPLLWAGDGRTMVAGYALLLGAWLWAALGHGADGTSARDGWASWGLLVLPMLLLWLAAALSGHLGGTVWASAALLAAGLVACGAFPAGGWRPAALWQRPQTAVMLLALPVLAGAKLLLPLAQPGTVSGGVLALGAAAGLVTLLMAIRSFFSNEITMQGLALSVASALAGMVVLAALWAGQEGLLAQVRAAVVAPAILLLLPGVRAANVDDRLSGSRLSPAALGVGVVAAALAAVPLTAGFRGMGGVYEGWLAVGGWPLVVVAALLMTLLVAAAVGRGRLVLVTLRELSGRSGWLGAAPALLLGLGLLAVPWPWLGEQSPLVWAAILLPLVIGVAGALILGRQSLWADLLATSVPTLPALWRDSRAAAPARRAGRFVAAATSDALAILEGPYGLLWVLALLALFVVLA